MVVIGLDPRAEEFGRCASMASRLAKFLYYPRQYKSRDQSMYGWAYDSPRMMRTSQSQCKWRLQNSIGIKEWFLYEEK